MVNIVLFSFFFRGLFALVHVVPLDSAVETLDMVLGITIIALSFVLGAPLAPGSKKSMPSRDIDVPLDGLQE